MATYQIARFVPAFVNDNLNYPSKFRNPSVSNTPVLVGSAGTITAYGWNLINTAGTDVFVKLYDSTAAPVIGTAIPIETLQVKISSSVVLYGAEMIIYCTLGLWVAVTLNSADSDNTAPASNAIIHINYKQ